MTDESVCSSNIPHLLADGFAFVKMLIHIQLLADIARVDLSHCGGSGKGLPAVLALLPTARAEKGW